MKKDKTRNITALIVGMGSIGIRRFNILKGMKGVTVDNCDSDSEYSSKLEKNRYQAILICSPPQFHVEQAFSALAHGANLFIEKPLSHNLVGVDGLLKLAQKKESDSRKPVRVMSACNLRYNKTIREAAFLFQNEDVLYANAIFGYNLSYWRKNGYVPEYSLSNELGGGILLDSIHEIDYINHLFGPIRKLEAKNLGRFQGLDAESLFDGRITLASGACVDIHLNCLTHTYTRHLNVVGKNRHLSAPVVPDNLMYKKEMEDFIKMCEDAEHPNPNPLQDSAFIFALSLLARDKGSCTAKQVNNTLKGAAP